MRNPKTEELVEIHELERKRQDLLMELSKLELVLKCKIQELRKICEVNYFTPVPLDSATLTKWVQIMGFSQQGMPMEKLLIDEK